MGLPPRVPPDIAGAFLQYRLRVQHSSGTIIRRVPDQLFETWDCGGWIARSYFAPAANDLLAAPVPFRFLAGADLEWWEGHYRPAALMLGSESAPEDHRERIYLRLRDIYDGLPQVSIEAAFDGRLLWLLYDGDGLLHGCSLRAENGAGPATLARMGTEAAHIRPGDERVIDCGDARYELSREGDALTFRRSREGREVDCAGFPTAIDREAFLDELFPEPLRVNPLGVPPEPLYDAWKYQHPFPLLGVSWERFDEASPAGLV